MAISNIGGSSAAQLQGTVDSQASAFREADFLKIMLTEITKQDPLEPAETSKLVENMQKLQELANTQYTRFRNDLQWAQQLVGRSVTVGQVQMDDGAYDNAKERGLNPDRGYGVKEGLVGGFRVVGEQVWVQIGDNDYPVDKVQTITPEAVDHRRMAEIAGDLLTRQVQWLTDEGTLEDGIVERMTWDEAGQITLHTTKGSIGFDRVRAIAK